MFTNGSEVIDLAYEHDIFVSYSRSPTVGQWVCNHLVPRLEARLGNISRDKPKIFCDFKIEEGTNWPAELKRQLRGSRLLLTIWSADYFRSRWCMAEWESFQRREAELGLFSDASPQGLVYPVRYADGEHFHPRAKETQCRKDFSTLNYPDEVFRLSPKYMEFDDLVQRMADDLEVRLREIPPWRSDFPIVEPQALPPAVMQRPVI